MRASTIALSMLAATADAQLHKLAKRAGLMYFGAATDRPGMREREGKDAAYPQYDAILDNTDEFGQTTPTNGQKVRRSELSIPHIGPHAQAAFILYPPLYLFLFLTLLSPVF